MNKKQEQQILDYYSIADFFDADETCAELTATSPRPAGPRPAAEKSD